MRPEAIIRLHDVLRACERVESFIKGMSIETFREDERTQAAVERQIEIIGEALNVARKLDASVQVHIPETPQIVKTRNLFIHAYAYVSASIVYQIATQRVPPLKELILKIVASHPPLLSEPSDQS